MNKFKKYIKTITPITDSEFEETFLYFSTMQLKKGDFFVKQDEVCQYIAYIQKGALRTFYVNEKGEDITSCFCTENHFITSYKSFILQQPSHLSLQAIEETELIVINFPKLQELYTNSTTWQTIGRKLSEKEYFVMEHYAATLNNETAKEKYIRLIKEQPHVLQKATVEDIASYLGITRRTLSRIRNEIAKTI